RYPPRPRADAQPPDPAKGHPPLSLREAPTPGALTWADPTHPRGRAGHPLQPEVRGVSALREDMPAARHHHRGASDAALPPPPILLVNVGGGLLPPTSVRIRRRVSQQAALAAGADAG